MDWYILKDKVPVKVGSIYEFIENKTGDESNIVKRDYIGEVCISTVFLGLNHNWAEGTPILFETMIFGGEHANYQERYSTWEEAEIGHQKAVNLVKIKLLGNGEN